MRSTLLVLTTMLLAGLAGCATNETPPPSTDCPTKPTRANLALSDITNPVVIWNTTMGCFAAELYLSKAPVTAGNFHNLTKSGFYDGTRFHRVIAGFMIQDGDPLTKDTSKKASWGTGDPGYDIADEFPCKDGFVSRSWPADCAAHGGQLYSHSKVGTLSMANAGRPHDGGSQYFVIVTPRGQPRTDLDPKHPIFGVVVWNMNVVEAISRTTTDSEDRPFTDVVIRSLKVL